MMHKLLHGLGFVVVALLALGAGTAFADSVGPYYATPSWDQTLPSSTRFIVLSNFNSEAVLDRNTGLVWERSPPTNFGDWFTVRLVCANKAVGGQKGWRLPSFPELASLVDPSVTNPSLPAGHPFTNVGSHFYTSATTDASNPANVWIVLFGSGSVISSNKTDGGLVAWCVRGGMNTNQY
jgi:hypothetical protein